MEDETITAADADRERRRLERVRRREAAAARRARRRRLAPVAAAALVVLGVLGGLLLLTTGATHGRRTPQAASRQPVSKPKPQRRKPAPSVTRTHEAVLPARPTVTFIGDSVADEIAYLSSARNLLGRGVDLRLQLAACRRLAEPSCTVAGYRPTTALQLVNASRASLGDVVIVAVGYNDYQPTFATDAGQVLAALKKAGVRKVLWLTLRATHHPYLAMNDALHVLAASTPQLEIVDWNRYSRSHPAWFKEDGLHLTHAGAYAMARLLHRSLSELPRASESSS
jgi:hypothetical protein